MRECAYGITRVFRFVYRCQMDETSSPVDLARSSPERTGGRAEAREEREEQIKDEMGSAEAVGMGGGERKTDGEKSPHMEGGGGKKMKSSSMVTAKEILEQLTALVLQVYMHGLVVWQRVAACCNVLQCVAACCNVLQCVIAP